MGVEPTILAAKDRIHGFEGHEDHRTLFASICLEHFTDDVRPATNTNRQTLQQAAPDWNYRSERDAGSTLRGCLGEFLASDFEKLRIGADFVVGASSLLADFSAGQ